MQVVALPDLATALLRADGGFGPTLDLEPGARADELVPAHRPPDRHAA